MVPHGFLTLSIPLSIITGVAPFRSGRNDPSKQSPRELTTLSPAVNTAKL